MIILRIIKRELKFLGQIGKEILKNMTFTDYIKGSGYIGKQLLTQLL